MLGQGATCNKTTFFTSLPAFQPHSIASISSFPVSVAPASRARTSEVGDAFARSVVATATAVARAGRDGARGPGVPGAMKPVAGVPGAGAGVPGARRRAAATETEAGVPGAAPRLAMAGAPRLAAAAGAAVGTTADASNVDAVTSVAPATSSGKLHNPSHLQ